jgi:hypothetical protein
MLSPSWTGRDSPTDDARALFQSLDGWRLFLHVERCALPLYQVMERAGLLATLPAPFLTLLTEETEWERKRIASARRQLQLIGRWATEHQHRPVVLKGGVSALGSAGIDLNDIDLLLEHDDAAALVTDLQQRGYRQFGYAGVHHLRGLVREDELLVEIHVTLDTQLVPPDETYWDRVEAIAEVPGLWRLAPADHLWNILTHGSVKHITRRGRLRDLLLLHQALADCSTRDIEINRRRAATHELAGVLGTTIDHVQHWADGAGDDPFEAVALTGYLLGQRDENRSRVHPTSGSVNKWVFAQLAGRAERHAIWASVGRRGSDLSGFSPVRRLQRLSPGLGRLVQIGGRFSTQVLAYAKAYPLSRSIGRTIRQREEAVGTAGLDTPRQSSAPANRRPTSPPRGPS